jgi:hypothetical protein
MFWRKFSKGRIDLFSDLSALIIQPYQAGSRPSSEIASSLRARALRQLVRIEILLRKSEENRTLMTLEIRGSPAERISLGFSYRGDTEDYHAT